MKIAAIFFVLFAIIFFLVGGVLAWFGILDNGSYAFAAAIVGSVASTVGLLGITSPRLTSSDIQKVESELINKLAAAAKDVKEYEKQISTNKEEIAQLQKERLEIELLVRQASIKIFMEEKVSRLSSEIEKQVLSDHALTEYLIEYEKTKKRIEKLDGEISTSEKAELIYQIIGEIKHDGSRFYIDVAGLKIDIGPVFRLPDVLITKISKIFHH
jgi:hypothetical protein